MIDVDYYKDAVEMLAYELGMLRGLNRLCKEALEKGDERSRVLALARIEQSVRGGTPW